MYWQPRSAVQLLSCGDLDVDIRPPVNKKEEKITKGSINCMDKLRFYNLDIKLSY